MTKTITTHSGNFHTDEIFAVATLLLIYPDAKVVRSRKQEEIDSSDIVVDVGGVYEPEKFRFDHHQPGGAGKRESGIPYASFGLVWKHFSHELVGEEEKEIIDSKLIAPIDAIDNGVNLSVQKFEGIREFTIYDFLLSYVDDSRTDKEYLFEIFMKLVEISQDLIKREITKAKVVSVGMQKVKEIVGQTSDRRIIILPEDLPWVMILANIPEALFVVYPRKEGSWGVKGVRKNPNNFELRKSLPEVWLGKTSEELSQITGVADAMFMHKERYLAAAKTKEGALKLAEIALNA